MLDIAGRVAVVTGGASGIGAACAERLEKEGAKVARWDLAEAPGVVRCDVSDAASVAAALQRTVKEWGSPSLLVAAAGVTDGTDILNMTPAVWDKVLGVNLRGVMLAVQAVARAIVAAQSNNGANNGANDRAAGGAMVLISSVNGVVADPGLSAYSASKAGVNHFARVAAREFGPLGIRVNAVGPGPTETPMLKGLKLPGYREEVIRRTPLGEVGSVARIAEAVAGLLKMDWVTGQALMVDGGSSLNTGRGTWKVD